MLRGESSIGIALGQRFEFDKDGRLATEQLDRDGRLRFMIEGQPDLSPAHQFDIDLRQQLRVEERAVQDPVGSIDSVA